MRAIIDKAGKWAIPVFAVLCLLLFTPIGRVVNFFVAGGAILGAGYLLLVVLFDLLDLKNFNDLLHWRDIGLKLAGAAGLLLLVVVAHFILPEAPTVRNCETEIGKSYYSRRCD